MIDPDSLAKLRHDLVNPLAGILAEVQMVLLDSETLTPDLKESLQQIERLAIRLRTILRDVP